MTTPDPTLAARLDELPTHWYTIAPRKHRHGDELAQIVYADPGVSGWYYRDRKPDSVTAYVRLDLMAASGFITRAEADAMVRAENEACAKIAENVAKPMTGKVARGLSLHSRFG